VKAAAGEPELSQGSWSAEVVACHGWRVDTISRSDRPGGTDDRDLSWARNDPLDGAGADARLNV